MEHWLGKSNIFTCRRNLELWLIGSKKEQGKEVLIKNGACLKSPRIYHWKGLPGTTKELIHRFKISTHGESLHML